MLIVGGFLLFGVGNLFYFAIQPLRGCRYIAHAFPALHVGLFRFNPFRIALRQLVVTVLFEDKSKLYYFLLLFEALKGFSTISTECNSGKSRRVGGNLVVVESRLQ